MKAIRKLNVFLLIIAVICTIIFVSKQVNQNKYGDYDKKIDVAITDISSNSYGEVTLYFNVKNKGNAEISRIELDIRVKNSSNQNQSLIQSVACSFNYLESLDSENLEVSFYTTNNTEWLIGKTKNDLIFTYKINSVTFSNGKIYTNENSSFNTNPQNNNPENPQNNHTHNYSLTKYDSTNHWKECSCGQVANKENHVYSSTKHDSTNHWKECSCGQVANKENHVYSSTKHDSTNHWKECSCGQVDNKENHVYSSTKHDSTNHWKECSCGEYDALENHKGGTATCKIKAKCSVCEQEYGQLLEHSYKDRKCEWCKEKEPSVGLAFLPNYNDTEYEVWDIGTCTDTDIVIPSMHNGKPVTSIGSYAFKDCSSLTSVEIPNSVTSIGGYAFYGCSSLASIEIPDGVTSIGSSAFRGCSKLTSVTIGNSVTTIGDYAFYNCSSLTSITIPNSVISIGERAFYNCSSLTSIVIPDGVTSIGNYTYYGCSKLTSVTIGNSVTTIGDYAFEGCSKLTSVTIGNSVTSIGSYAFEGCSSLTSVTIGNSVTSIGAHAFWSCYSLTSITIPNSVTSIGSDAFLRCYRLAEVYNLSSLNIEKGSYNNGYVGYYALDIYNSLSTPSKLTNENGYIIHTNGNVKTLVGYIGNQTDLLIPNNVTSIGDYAFVYCSKLTYNVKDGLKYLGNEQNKYLYLAGVESTNLTTANIDSNCRFIGYSAFYNCSSLTSIEIPDSVTSIGKDAFLCCDSLTSVTIPNSVTSIGSAAFDGCTSLTSIVIPNSVTSIGEDAFSYCTSLTSVTIGNSVTSIGEDAFICCYKLVEVYNLSSLNIEKGSFNNGCVGYYALDIYNSLSSPSKLTNENGYIIHTNGNVKTLVCYIGNQTDLVIPNNVTSIGNHAFYECRSLTSIEIPNSVTSIGEDAFCNCSSLTSIEIPNSVTSIGDWAFLGCSKLTIYCEAESKPSGWGNYWNSSCPVVWGYKG